MEVVQVVNQPLVVEEPQPSTDPSVEVPDLVRSLTVDRLMSILIGLMAGNVDI